MPRQLTSSIVLWVCWVGGSMYLTESFRVMPPMSLAPKVLDHSSSFRYYDPISRNSRITHQVHLPVDTSTSLASSMGVDSTAIINKAALKAIGKLLSTCSFGVVAGKLGILDHTTLSALSKLIFNIFQPCLLFVNVARTIANLNSSTVKGGSVEAIYMLPLAAAIQIFVGFIVGKLLSYFVYKNYPSTDEEKELMTCTTFANSGPLPLVFTEGLFHSSVDSTLVSRSAAYISLYLLGWSPLFWVIAPTMLQHRDSHNHSHSTKANKELLRRVFSPPVIASLLGMCVGFVPYLRKLIVYPDSPLSVVYESMRMLGTAYLPAVLLVLAGSLSPPASKGTTSTATYTEDSTMIDKQFIMKVTSIYLARFILMPTITFGILKMISKLSPAMASLFAKDRLLLFVLLLESCMPSAQNTTVIMQLQGSKAGATKLARTLMLLYVLGVPAITYWLVQILKFSNIA